MMYAVDYYCFDNTTHETLWFDAKDDAITKAREIEAEGWRVIVTETTGDADDERHRYS